MPSPFTIAIATHNRCEDLRTTMKALRALDPAPSETLVCADGCSDGTAEMLAAEFPECRVLENFPASGSVASRDRMMREARGEFVLSLDDDSHPVEPDLLVYAESRFRKFPRLAVASFPQRSDEFPESLTRTGFGPSRFTGSYANSGAAVRRSMYLDLPGYHTTFFHAYEEPDFSLQCFARGWQTRLCTGRSIRHRYTPRERSERRTHAFHARNEAWSVLMRCPAPWLPAVLAFRAASQFAYACRRGPRWVASEPAWWFRFLSGAPAALRARHPLPWNAYLGWMRLLRNPAGTEAEWNRLCPSAHSFKSPTVCQTR